jgi:phosphonopyruvate decarboxylase
MLEPSSYLLTLKECGITFFSGVPDSLLKEICFCITETISPDNHVIAANEGAAVGLSIGHYIGTGKIPLVYLQNSGLGNLVNPLLSLASPEVYGIPMLIMIGWRGEPGHDDEPQHIHQGRVMVPMLEAMNIPITILSNDPIIANQQTREAAMRSQQMKGPVALIVRKGTFKKFQRISKEFISHPMSREQAIMTAAEILEDNAAVICTTGMASRELFEFRVGAGTGHQRDFLTVGGMGHANQIALGLALARSDRTVYCFDGDGAALMHMGSMAIIGQSSCTNLIHLVFNNGVHGSVGGQPTVGFSIDIAKIALACGYISAKCVETPEALISSILDARTKDGPTLIEVRVRPGNRDNIGRPTTTPENNKLGLMEFMKADYTDG